MATKKTIAKKPTTRKTTTRKSSSRKAVTTSKKPAVRSFQRCEETQPFMTMRLTRQTIYWLIIAVLSIAFTVWVLKLQSDINELYSQIDHIRASEPVVPAPEKHSPAE